MNNTLPTIPLYIVENIIVFPHMKVLITGTNNIPVPSAVKQYFCQPESMKGPKANNLDMITKVPGLKHICEDIFKLLDKYQSMDCRLVNKSWKEIVDQPMFNLKKMKSGDKYDLPKDVHKNWKLLAQKLKDNYHLGVAQELVLILRKMSISMNEPKFPLEIVFALGKAEKYPSVMKFILENEDITQKISFRESFDQNVSFKCWKVDKVNVIDLAARFGLRETLEKLTAKYGSPMLNTDENGDNPIHLAALKGHLETIKFLSKFTDTPNAPNVDGDTPLAVAAAMGHLDAVKYFKTFTDTPNAPNEYGITPIHYASSQHLDVVKYLVNFTDNPNSPDNFGWTPIHEAAQTGNETVIKYLVELTDASNSTNWDEYGDTPIHIAAYFGHLNVVKYLVNFTEDLDWIQNDNGLTPTDLAREKGYDHIATFLENYHFATICKCEEI